MALFAGLELKEFNAASLTGAYQDLGSVLSNPCYRAVISNESDVGVYVTSDGTTDQIRLSPGQILVLTFNSKHNNYNEGSYVFKKGTQLEIKQVTAPGTGAIIVNVQTTRGYV